MQAGCSATAADAVSATAHKSCIHRPLHQSTGNDRLRLSIGAVVNIGKSLASIFKISLIFCYPDDFALNCALLHEFSA